MNKKSNRSESKKKGTKKGMFIFICILVFIISFVLGIVSKTIKPKELTDNDKKRLRKKIRESLVTVD